VARTGDGSIRRVGAIVAVAGLTGAARVTGGLVGSEAAVGVGVAVAGGSVAVEVGVAVAGGSVAVGAGVAEARSATRVAATAVAEGLAPSRTTARGGTVGINGSGVGRANKAQALSPANVTDKMSITNNARMAKRLLEGSPAEQDAPQADPSIPQLGRRSARIHGLDRLRDATDMV
jgi:hypothetical protein